MGTSLIFTYILAFLGGFIPGALWLFLWMSEDKKNPEPKRLIALTFCVGILSVPIALFLQQFFAAWYIGPYSLRDFFENFPVAAVGSLIVFAAIEEFSKFAAAYVASLWRRDVDEPIDYIIYLIAAALGFAAYETALFMFTPLNEGQYAVGFITGNVRAIGAMLLHVVSSSTIGVMLAFAFYRRKTTKIMYGIIGFIIATILHSLFNIGIMIRTDSSSAFAFMGVWIAVVVLLALFERVKKIHPTFIH